MSSIQSIIAVDFDGTVVTHEYPVIGRDVGAVPVLRELAQAGHLLILLTMRHGQELVDAEQWFNRQDIPLWGVNTNPTQAEWTASRKVYAHHYIDDAAIGCPLREGVDGERPHVDWQKTREMLGGLRLLNA